MNTFLKILNERGENFLNFAGPMFWQSSALILILFALDFLLRRKLRAPIRYALWLIVLIKLILSPTFALPTNPIWWLHKTSSVAAKIPKANYTVTYDQNFPPEVSQLAPPAFVPPKPELTVGAWLLVISICASFALLLWMLARWLHVAKQVRHAQFSERLTTLVIEAQKFGSLKFNFSPQVKLTTNSMSPAVCGLFRPTILIPQSLAENFSDEQLRAVLLHELFHLRRGDVWVNFGQTLLQIFYWWHPLLWLANARIRRVREEAVDDAVMLALRDDAETYAPTLLEVAKLALNRPLASLGLVGILESRHALRQRIERLLNFRAPKKVGLTFLSLCGIFIFSAVALPMGEKPVSKDNLFLTDTNSSEMKSLTVKVNPEIFIRNVKARADQYLLSPTNDYTVILLEIMRSEDEDCSPPHGIAFNTKTGEITTQNSPEQLEIFQQVIEQLNRADGICELPLHNNLHRKSVLIEARLYEMSAADFKRIASDLQFYPNRPGSDAWWSSSPENFKPLIETVESAGFNPIQRPRIQTGSGMPADFYVGNATNSVDFECKPFAQEGSIDLRIRGTVINQIQFTNRFNIEASAENGGGIVIRAENFAGHSESNLVTIINMLIVTNTPRYQQRLVAVIKRHEDTVATNLFERTFKVDTRTFIASLKRTGADLGKTNSPAAISMAVRKFLISLGVNLDSPSGKAVFFNDQNGLIFVRASLSDLDTLERAIEVLNQVPPQIHIKARFLEVPKGTVAGFEKYLNTTNSTTNLFTGILNSTNLKLILHSLESRKDVKTLAEPEVTTTSGRQSRLMAGTEIPIIGSVTAEVNAELPADLPNRSLGNVSVTNNNVTFHTTPLDTGAILDSTASVLADGCTIQLRAQPSFTEFFGYAAARKSSSLPEPRPSIRVRKTEAVARLYDGQTLLFAGFKTTTSAEEHIPKKSDKELLVFVTADIVDSAGNRVHADADLPFAQKGVPPQPQK